MNRLLLWEAVEQGIQGPNRRIAVVKLNTDIRKDMNQMLMFEDESVKAKSKLAIGFLVEAATDGCRYDYQDVVEALQILKSLGYDLKDVVVYYTRGLPAIFTCDGEIAVVVAPDNWSTLSNLKTVEVFPLVPEGVEEEAGA